MRFSYRRYQEGDAPSINELYFHVTGRHRTVAQHAWQWLKSPAGESEMWLIEAESDDGSRSLIGHHGVMAEAFTYRGAAVRVGKTENTMVLPEFRDKILYPRFERIFLGQYEGSFHALFSTMGPEPAIRLRKAMGYEARHKWVNIYSGTEPSISFHVALGRFLGPSNALASKLEAFGAASIGAAKITRLNEEIPEFDFNHFWAKASKHYGLTPARTQSNLHWRFWSNPHRKHYTFKLEDPNLGVGICILSLRDGHWLYVDDIFCERPEMIARFLEILQNWSARTLRVGTLASMTTADSLDYFRSAGVRQTSWIHRLSNVVRRTGDQRMPRKVTALGRSVGIKEDSPWFVTPFFFEGR